jgi:hypothetical protein
MVETWVGEAFLCLFILDRLPIRGGRSGAIVEWVRAAIKSTIINSLNLLESETLNPTL